MCVVGDVSTACNAGLPLQCFFLVARMVRNGLRLAPDSPSARVWVKESGVSKAKISWKTRFLPSLYRSSDRTSRPSFQSTLLFRVRQATGAALSHQNTLNPVSLSARQKTPSPAISPSIPLEWYSSMREFEPGPARHISSPSPAFPLTPCSESSELR